MAYLRNAWYVALWSKDLRPGELVRRTLLGEPVLFFRREDGTAAAVTDICPHRFAPLHLGRLLPGDVVRCSYHGLEFAADGRCVGNPHGDGTIPHGASLRTYPVLEKHTRSLSPRR